MTKFGYLILSLLFILMVGIGCDESHYNRPDGFDKAVDACIRVGGIPITGMWNTLERCDTPPNCVLPSSLITLGSVTTGTLTSGTVTR